MAKGKVVFRGKVAEKPELVQCPACQERFALAMREHIARVKAGEPSVMPKVADFTCKQCKPEWSAPTLRTGAYSGTIRRGGVETPKRERKARRDLIDAEQRRNKPGKAERARKREAAKAKAEQSEKRKRQRKPVERAIWCATFGDEVGGVHETPTAMTQKEAKVYFLEQGLCEADGGWSMDHAREYKRLKWSSKYQLWKRFGTEVIS